jgi:hypothetical protein
MPESVTPIKFRTAFRTLGIIFLGIGMLFGSLHLFLYYRSNSLLKGFVEQMSQGQYTATAQKVRFGYLPFRIKAVNIHFFPKDTVGVSRLYDLKGDTLQLKLTSLAPLIFYNSLEVREVRLVKPMVEVISDGSMVTLDEARFNIPIKEIQEGLLKSLDFLQVDKCEIIDGGFKLMRRDISKNLAVNHIDLVIDSLLAAKSGIMTRNGDTVNANFLLTITKPDIEIPDSNYLVDVDRLMVDTRKNIFEIDELRFSRYKDENAYDTIKLSTISLTGLDWKSFLEQGIISLDTIRVENGLAQIDLTDRFIFQRRKDKANDAPFKVEVPLKFNYASVQQVSYQLRSQRKTGPFTILLDGDSLLIKDFSLMDTTPNPLQLGSLSLNVRNYHDQDDKKTYMSGFDRLFIRDNNLYLTNYRLIPIRHQLFSTNNVVEVPSLTLYNYDLAELLQGRLDASRLELLRPTIVLDVLGKADTLTAKTGKLAGFFSILNRLQPTLNIEHLMIDNARVILQPRRDVTDTIVISQLSTEINVERLLAAQSIEDLMTVTEGVRSKGFFITGNRFEFKVTEATVSPDNNYLAMDRLQGSLEGGVEMDLEYVQIFGKKGELLIPVDGFLPLSRVSIASGALMIAPNARKNKEQNPKKAPVLQIDSLHTGDLSLTYLNQKGEATTIDKIAMDVNGLVVDNDHVSWIDAWVEGAGLRTGVGISNINVGVWYGSLPGSVTMESSRIWPAKNTLFGITANLPKVQIQQKLQRIDQLMDAVEKIDVYNPSLRWSLNSQDSNQKEFIAERGVLIPELNIYNPDMEGYRFSRQQEQRHVIVKEGKFSFKNIDLFHSNPSELLVGSFAATLQKPSIEITDKWVLQPTNINVLSTNIRWSSGALPTGFIDSLTIAGVGNLPVFEDSTKALALNSAGIKGWHFPFATDSLLFRLSNGPAWWVNGADFSSQGKHEMLKVYNLSANREESRISFDSLSLLPHLNRDSFWSSSIFQKDYIELTLGKTNIFNFQPTSTNLKGGQLKKIHISDFNLLASRDKQYPRDSVSYRALLARQIQSLPMDISIDTVQIDDGKITYTEIGEKWGLEGTFFMDKIHGDAYGFYTMSHPDADSLILDIRARMFGVAPMHLQFGQAYDDSLQNFRFDAMLSGWDLRAANNLLAPLNSFEFLRGSSDSLWLSGWGNDNFAYGWMGFDYHKMRMGILKEGYNRNYFFAAPTNFFTNLLIINNNNGKPIPFYAERLQDRAIFNYWAKMMTAGVMGSFGVPGYNRKARNAFKRNSILLQRPGP